MKNLVWILIAIVFLASRLMWIQDPICYDEAGWAQIAREVVYHGKTLYVDFFDNKPPLVYPVYLLSALVVREPSELGMRVFGLVFQGVSLGILIWVFKKYVSRGAAIFVGLTEAVVGTSLVMEGQCWLMTEQLMKPVFLLWFLCLFKTKTGKRVLWWFVLGAVTGVMMWMKQTYLFMLVPLVIYAGWRGRSIRLVLVSIMGWTAVSVITVGFFLVTGMFDDLKAGAWDFNMTYYINGTSTFGTTLEALAKRSFYLWPVLAVLAWVGKRPWYHRRNMWLSLTVLSLVVIGLYSAWAGGERMYRHYLVLIVFPLIMYAGVGWAAIRNKRIKQWVIEALSIVLLYTFGLNVYQREKFLAKQYQDFYQELNRIEQLSRSLNAGNEVKFWGEAMQFYYPLNVRLEDKFFIATGVLTFPGLESELDLMRRRVMKDHPKLIVTDKKDLFVLDAQIQSWLQTNYKYRENGNWIEWTRID
ncbi:hypothetical protein A2368_01185 [Candidatus Collierbacteria bacterium RIFOXYB1_FULL_49_13]|uniref:Glycosyltransferase RgtA/B/C/D-like domain-containing protein n=1 Tax=Candidatus Collierbacteria bacterium RIFOXYB1_FULL_49_13 TaxID=1817728 RepID=A0A1F5FB33_9BACT|nr:MAG: hypothetical protein A2368_01185 [Candidatus Collierbacteria bacterium RIFOXYB1_FULL_49_13]